MKYLKLFEGFLNYYSFLILTEYNDYDYVNIIKMKEEVHLYSQTEGIDLDYLTSTVMREIFIDKIVTLKTERFGNLTGVVNDVDCNIGNDFSDYDLYIELDEYPEDTIDSMYDNALDGFVKIWKKNSETYKNEMKKRIQKRFDL